jgi:guanine deaminase
MRVGLATDTGGGSSFSMLRTMAAAYEVGQLRGTRSAPLATVVAGDARLGPRAARRHRIGNLAPGMEADIVVIDLASTPAIEQATRRAEDDLAGRSFPTIMMGDDRAIRAVWVGGKQAV